MRRGRIEMFFVVRPAFEIGNRCIALRAILPERQRAVAPRKYSTWNNFRAKGFLISIGILDYFPGTCGDRCLKMRSPPHN